MDIADWTDSTWIPRGPWRDDEQMPRIVQTVTRIETVEVLRNTISLEPSGPRCCGDPGDCDCTTPHRALSAARSATYRCACPRVPP